MSKPKLTLQDFCRAAERLKCEVESIKSVAETESLGQGFYSDGFPVILFERHKFRAFTHGKYDRSHPHLSNINPGGYGKAGQNQRNKFNEAFKLNPEAAMMACSWGKFQIMGFNWASLDYKSIHEFVDRMKLGEAEHLEAFIRYVLRNGLQDELQRKDFKTFARIYNGKNYRKNKYDTKMQSAYQKYVGLNLKCLDETPPELTDEEFEIPEPEIVDIITEEPIEELGGEIIPAPPATGENGGTETKVEVGGGQVNVETSTAASPSSNVAVEREPERGFFQKLWLKVTGALAGVGGTTAITEHAQQVQLLGLSSSLWQTVFYLACGGAGIWIVYEGVMYLVERYQARHLTNKLIDTNSTDTNVVTLAKAEDLAKYEAEGWVVVRRGN